MEYNYDDIEKIIGFTSWSDSKKISELFRIDSFMYTNLKGLLRLKLLVCLTLKQSNRHHVYKSL